MGRNWLAAIQFNWAYIKQVRTGLDTLLQKYSDVFRKELGTLQGIKVKLTVQENAMPKFYEPRAVPYAIRGAIEKDDLSSCTFQGSGALECARTKIIPWSAKFIHHLSTITQPLNHLLCQSVSWKWTKECQQAFLNLKRQLVSSEVLVHYDPDLPLKLDNPASAGGLGL